MNTLDISFYIAVAGSFISILVLKFFNITEYSKINIVEINSADKNISSARIEEIINKFILYLGLTNAEIKINYGNSDTYSQIYSMLNRRKKEINIPKWIMPSVGYELDYLLASIWYNVKLYKKDKGVRKMQFFISVAPFMFMFIYYIFIFLIVALLIIRVFIMDEIYFNSSFLYEIFNFKILELISLTFYFLFIICEFNTTRMKMLLEMNYERNIVKFVDEELGGYKADLSAARLYAIEVKKLNYETFRINSKTQNIKYLGPFVKL